jgi:hypothetical protein
MSNPIPVPNHDRVVDERGYMTRAWVDWMTAQAQGVASSASLVSGSTNLASQEASIGTTALPIQVINLGLYRVNTYVRVTRPGTTSSIQVSVHWTESSQALSASATALNGNTVTTVQGAVFTILVDAATTISYSTTYSSTGATPMQYRLFVAVERVDA